MVLVTVTVMDDLYVDFGRKVRHFRKTRKLSQDDVALLTNIGRASIAAIERGRQAVALHQALALCEALDVNLPDLLPKTNDSSTFAFEALKGLLDGQDLEIVERLHEEMA